MNSLNRHVSYLARACALAFAVVGFAVGAAPAAAQDSTIRSDASLQTLLGSRTWLNGTPTSKALHGKVVLVDVFTFDCINCKNITPNLRSLSRTKRNGLAILGIHTPETAYERDRGAVVSHLDKLGVTWPVAIDNDYTLWKAYNVEYWPTQLIFDRRGKLRKVVIGDSQDALVNATVNELLREPA